VRDEPPSESVLAIVPARGGSKRVLNKNLRLLGGKPLLAYPIEVARASPRIGRVLVSTDDDRIAEAGRRAGADVPFLRPAELAQDSSGDREVLVHALGWLAEHEGYHPELVIWMRCTTPFKTTMDIDRLLRRWAETGADSVRSMTRVSGVHHPYWMYREVSGRAEPIVPGEDARKYYQSQLLPPVYRLNGVLDGVSAAVALKHPDLWGDNTALIEIPDERAVDIDTELDLKWAEFLLRERDGA